MSVDEVISEFFAKLLESQEPMDSEIEAILTENLWELYDKE